MSGSGQYRHRVDIRVDQSNDGDENPDFSGDPFAKCLPGNMFDVSGMENWRGRQIEATITHIFETRFYKGIEPEMRIDFDGRQMQISRVLDRDGRRRYLEIQCFETV